MEGLALRRLRSSTAHIHRQAVCLASERGWLAPSYGTVRSIVVALDPGLTALAHDGPACCRDRFQLVYRREVATANAVWQVDHTQLERALRAEQSLPCCRGSATVQQVSDALQLTIRFEPGEDGWIIASIPEVPGALSQGRTREEARANVIDALRLMLTPEPDAPPSDSEPLQLTIAA